MTANIDIILRGANSYEALRELSIQVAIFIAVKTDVDKDFNINHDNKNERRMWTAFDNLKTAQANAALALADEVKS